MIEDAPNPDLEPGGSASSSPTATAQSRRGHWPKIHEAVTALRAQGKLPPNLRPCHRDGRIQKWLLAEAEAYGDDLPDRWAIRRYFQTLEGGPAPRTKRTKRTTRTKTPRADAL
jgi:hypothetical protein